jgi:hypothetical protein
MDRLRGLATIRDHAALGMIPNSAIRHVGLLSKEECEKQLQFLL